MIDIKSPIPTPQEAFDLLSANIRNLDWFIANNRTNRLEFYQNHPNPLIRQMSQDKGLSKEAFQEKYFSDFDLYLYFKNGYKPFVKEIENTFESIQKCSERLEKLNQSWGLEILPAYHVDLDLFSTGGRYFRDKKNIGHIIVGAGCKLSSTERLAHLIVHEIIHLGIEDLVINPQHLENPPIQQEEKERIVDNLCIYVVNGILPSTGFQERTIPYAYMDKVVGQQPQTHLVNAVRQFLSSKEHD